jgi:type I restriction enzyme S subunit
VIDRLRPYGKYKESGLPWLPEIPTHWDVARNGRLFIQRNQTGFFDLPILEVSLNTGVRVRNFDEPARKQVMANRAKYKRAAEGDIAYNMMRMWQGAVGRVPVDGLVSPAYVVARPFDGIDTRFFAYLFRTAAYKQEVNNASRGIVPDRNRLYWADFKRLSSLVPSGEEQAAIVRFLDHANGRIERAIRAKKQLIALLNEQRQAIIDRAVTRGIDSTLPLKPCGIPWLGDIPKHWQLRRLKSISQIRYGLGQPPRETVTGLPLIRATNVDCGRIVEKNLVRVDPADVPKTRNAFLTEGEIIVVRSGALTADSAIIPKKYEGAVAGYDMVVTVRKARPDFIAMALLSSYVRSDQLIIASMRAAQPHLNAEELGTAIVLLPPDDEQKRLVKNVEDKNAPLDEAIARTEREIGLIREYRARLTVAVVTGKLDVRAAVRHLPAEAEELSALIAAEDLTDEAELELTLSKDNK